MDPDPGPYSEYGYGSTQVLKTDPIWIRVYNTAIYFTYTDSARHFSGISCCCDRDKLLRDILSRDKYNTCMYNAHIYCIYVYWPMWSIHRLRLSSWDTDILHKTLLGFTTMNMFSLLHKGTVLWDFYHIIFPSWNLNHQGPLVRVFSNLVPIEPSGPLIKSIF